MSDLVAPLQLANVVNGRHEKARDGRHELTLENKIWLHMALVDNPSGTGLEHWRLVLNSSATVRSCIVLNTSLGCAVTCSSHCADTSSQIVTLPRGKKTGPRSASQAGSFRNALPVKRAFFWVAATFLKILLRKVDNGAVVGETKEEALSKLQDVPVPAEAKTEVR